MKNDDLLSGKELAHFSPVAPKPPRHRILVVDDDPDTRQLSVDVLVSTNFEVDAAADGADGWKLLCAKHFDLVITDNKMPRMTGVELIEKLRYTGLPLPVIMATSELPTLEFARKPWLLPDAILERPFSNDDLVVAIKKVLRTGNKNLNQMEMLFPKDL